MAPGVTGGGRATLRSCCCCQRLLILSAAVNWVLLMVLSDGGGGLTLNLWVLWWLPVVSCPMYHEGRSAAEAVGSCTLWPNAAIEALGSNVQQSYAAPCLAVWHT